MAGGTAFQAPSSPFRGLKGRSAALRREQPFFAASFSHAVQSVPTCSPPEQKWQAGTPGAFPKGRPGKRRGHGRQVMAEAHFLLLSAVPHQGGWRVAEKSPHTSTPSSQHALPWCGDAAEAGGHGEPGLCHAGSVPAAPQDIRRERATGSMRKRQNLVNFSICTF